MTQTSLGSMAQSLEDLYESLYYGLGIADLGIAGAILMATIIVSIVTAVVSFLVTVILWILEAIPLYKLSKKTNRKYAWLAWVPILGNYFRMYVLADIPGDKPFSVASRSISRNMAFWIYIGIDLFGVALVNVIVAIINFFIPVVGLLALAFNLLPLVCAGFMEYIFLKDVLDVFKADQKSSNVAAIVITVLDNLVTLGFARLVFLYTLLKYTPLNNNVNKDVNHNTNTTSNNTNASQEVKDL